MDYRDLLELTKKYPNCCRSSASNRKSKTSDSKVFDDVKIIIPKEAMKDRFMREYLYDKAGGR